MPVSLAQESRWYKIKVTEIKMKPFWKRWLFVHKYTGGVRTVYDKKGKKRHAYICLRCGKKDYID